MKQLHDYLLKNHTEQLLSLKVRTLVKLKKKGHSFGEIYKTQVLNLKINKSYTEAVNEQREVEGSPTTFVAKQSWGKQVCTISD